MILAGDANNDSFDKNLSRLKFQYKDGKEYQVQVKLPRRNITETLSNAIRLFKCGVVLDGYRTAPSQAMVISQSQGQATFKIILENGEEEQIRKIMEKAGLKILNLQYIKKNK
jgi:16S rRNA U516 pseudouridylate synthase RsuA-like enzyme